MMEADEQLEAVKPPYISYTTLTSFIDNKLGGEMVPPRIDRGFLDNYAGSVQAQLLHALRVMGLIKDDGTVDTRLRNAARHPNERKSIFRLWAQAFYAEQFALAEQNGTAQMLHESFAKYRYTGSTLRKAVVFYLTLVDDVGMKKSPHFKPPRQSPQVVRARRDPSPKTVRAPQFQEASPPTPRFYGGGTAAGETKTVQLGSAGHVEIVVNVRWLDLPIETFTKLRKVIEDLESLAVPEGPVREPFLIEEHP
jgi:hypothetical protein